MVKLNLLPKIETGRKCFCGTKLSGLSILKHWVGEWLSYVECPKCLYRWGLKDLS